MRKTKLPRFESPTENTVSADLYVLHPNRSEDFWASLETRGDAPKGFVAREPEVQKEDLPLPDGMEGWRHRVVSISPSDMEKRLYARRIGERGFSLLPDTLAFSPLRLVSSRMKEFLEGIFPEGGVFYPATFKISETEKLSEGDYWYWLPKNLLRFNFDVAERKHKTKTPHAWASLSDPCTTWEMGHNSVFQDYVKRMPYFTSSPRFRDIVFRADVYQTLKAEGFSGVKEAPMDNHLEDKKDYTVGYVIYSH